MSQHPDTIKPCYPLFRDQDYRENLETKREDEARQAALHGIATDPELPAWEPLRADLDLDVEISFRDLPRRRRQTLDGSGEPSRPQLTDDRRADQQAAVGTALDAQVLGRGDVAGDEILGDGNEIVEVVLVLLLDGGLVPLGPELAAATDVGEDP